MHKLPLANTVVTTALIEKLRTYFPNRLPKSDKCTLEELRFAQGMENIISIIESWYEEERGFENDNNHN